MPVLTEQEVARVEGILLHDAAVAALNFGEREMAYTWLTTCWSCGHDMHVWMENLFGWATNTLPADGMRDAIARTFPAGALSSFGVLGVVTTKAGGTYCGFTCPCCGAVQGRHFLKQALGQKLLSGEVTGRWFGPIDTWA